MEGDASLELVPYYSYLPSIAKTQWHGHTQLPGQLGIVVSRAKNKATGNSKSVTPTLASLCLHIIHFI
jgi:hypothetical protein